ncbi:hypothetical protein CYY_009998 [Polysphondylium violaceum]|uniref:Uncharacterized protein n=1 Tax=Polysphondylium violaceum TaxID=133409 RepID=A0A8J4PJH1_9MYCE|nr:hypothetical protein CYY_009998 [Polysphondylium violaceum]
MEHTIYSPTPTPPKIREGLKALVLPDCFSQVIHNNSLPTTLQSLSILNPAYNNSLNSNNLPTSLTSLRCNSKNIKLDLSAYESIKELKVDGDSIIHFPPNLKSLEIKLKCKDEKKDAIEYKFHTVNKHLIKKLVIHTNRYVYVNKILNIGFPNLQYLSTNLLHSIVPTSVQELDIKERPDICQLEQYVSPNIKEIHLKLNSKILKEISSPLHGMYVP